MSDRRSLYSWVSWFNKVWKKILEARFINDVLNIWRQYLPYAFQHWRLPWLLRFCKIEFSQSLRWPQYFQPKSHVQNNFPCPKIFFQYPTKIPCLTNFFFPCLKNIFPTKNLMSQKNFSNQNPMSKEKRFSVSTKIFHAQKFFFPTKIPCLAKILQCSKKIFHVRHKQKKRNSCPTTQKKNISP